MVGDAASWSTGSLEETHLCEQIIFFIFQKLQENSLVSSVQFLLLIIDVLFFYLVYFYFHINYYVLMYFFIMNSLLLVYCGILI